MFLWKLVAGKVFQKTIWSWLSHYMQLKIYFVLKIHPPRFFLYHIFLPFFLLLFFFGKSCLEYLKHPFLNQKKQNAWIFWPSTVPDISNSFFNFVLPVKIKQCIPNESSYRFFRMKSFSQQLFFYIKGFVST